MTTEGLKWLELSTPSTPSQAKPVEASQQPCPTCGWPVAAKAEICGHCGHALAGQPAGGNILETLGVQLLPAEIEALPAPEAWFADFSPDPPAFYNLRLQAEQLRVTTGFDRLICLDDIQVDHYQHQLEAALRALRDMRGRALLADEVGLGKTIEAGIVMKELIERGLAETILILTPASLTWQWHEEMQTKFRETFTVLEQPDQLPDKAVEYCRWIISLDRAKSPGWAEALLAREYDLLIVDEAHKLKNHRTQMYQFVSSLRNRYLLMLTATPVHNNLTELYNLVSLLRPGHLGTRRAFRQNFVTSVPVNPVDTPKRHAARRTIYGTDKYVIEYLRKNRAARQKYRQEGQDTWLSKLKWTENFVEFETLKLGRQGREAAEEVQKLMDQGYEVFDFEAIQDSSWGNYSFVCRLKLKEQPQPKKQARPERRTVPRNPAVLRQLLREVMIRNRRASVGVRFPPRQAGVYSLNLTPPERKLYDQVTAYIWSQLKAQAQQPDQARAGGGPLKMTLMTLQKQLCSSPQAAARSLKSLVEQQPETPLTEALVLAWGIHQGRKVAATLDLLAHYPGKFLIFTDYLPTLEALQTALNEAGHETVTFHGGLAPAERVEIVRRFRQDPAVRVMISTQSGSEGHNLQFCHQMINYDLPWNPMRIEQRVGRLHRLGQPEAVSIFNLSANDTIEAYILDLLAHKIRMFELVIGELDLILGDLDEQRSFEQYIEEAWAKSYSEAELQQMIAELESILLKAQDSYQTVRSASDELSDLLDAFDEVHRI